MPLEKSARKVLVATRTGMRPIRPPRARWSNYIFDLGWCRIVVDPKELLEIADSREIFRAFLVALPLRLSSDDNV